MLTRGSGGREVILGSCRDKRSNDERRGGSAWIDAVANAVDRRRGLFPSWGPLGGRRRGRRAMPKGGTEAPDRELLG
jgi:hypothetical protein